MDLVSTRRMSFQDGSCCVLHVMGLIHHAIRDGYHVSGLPGFAREVITYGMTRHVSGDLPGMGSLRRGDVMDLGRICYRRAGLRP